MTDLEKKIELAISLTDGNGGELRVRSTKITDKTGHEHPALKVGDDAVEVTFKIPTDPKLSPHVVHGRTVTEAVDRMLAKVMVIADENAATAENWVRTNLEIAEMWKRMSTRVRLST